MKFAFAIITMLCISSAFAEEKTGLTDAERQKLVEKFAPTGNVEVDTSQKSQIEQCVKILNGLSVVDAEKCCKQEGCQQRQMKKAKKQADQAAFEKRRHDVNERRCIEEVLDSDKELCKTDPEYARAQVKALNDRVKQKTDAEQASRQAAEKAEKDRMAAAEQQERDRLAEKERLAQERQAHEAKLEQMRREHEARMAKLSSDNPPSSSSSSGPHYIDLVIAGGWSGASVATAELGVQYTPPWVNHLFTLGLNFGGAYIHDADRLQIWNFDPLFRGEYRAQLYFNVLDTKNPNFRVSPGIEYARVGRFGLDKKTAELPGAMLRLKFEWLYVEGNWSYNLGPKDGYVKPGSAFGVHAGLIFNLSTIR